MNINRHNIIALKYILWVLFLLAFNTGVLFSQDENKQEGDPSLDEIFLLMHTNPDLAIERSLSLYEDTQNDTQKQISILTLISGSYVVKNEYEKAIEYALKSRELSQQISDYTTQIKVAGFIGEKYLSLNINSKAKAYIDEAHELTRLHQLPDSLLFLRGNIYFLKGLVFQEELDCDFAIDFYNRALWDFKANLAGKKIMNHSIADTYNQKGFCYLEKHALDSAAYSFENAISFAKVIQANIIESEGWMGLGRIHYLNNDYQKANSTFQKALLILAETEAEVLNKEMFRYLADNYLALEDLNNYSIYNNLYRSMHSDVATAKARSINQIMIDIAMSQEETMAQNKKKYRQIIVTLSLVLVLLIAFILLKVFKSRKKIREYKDKLQEKRSR